jgi:GH24 family phage-related lysozyme (muramidase)
MRAMLLALFCAVSSYAAPVTTERAWVELVRWEGLRLVPYRDADGWSVGVGHALTRHGEPVRRRYTSTEVRGLFYHDLAVSLEACRAGVTDFDALPEEVQLVALNVAWSVGPEGFLAFKDLRRALSHRAYTAASVSLYLSRWYQQTSPSRANWAIQTLRSY